MIESGPNLFDYLKKFVVVVISLAVLGGASYFLYGLYKTNLGECALKTKTANPMGKCVEFERVTTNAEHAKGLSGRESLASNNAMLFVYETPGKQCMWMKNMKFSIDMIWLSKDKKITKVSRNVSPKTYPKSFCGGTSDKYVIETAADAIDDEQLKVGNQLNF